jgi:hypothetical protein
VDFCTVSNRKSLSALRGVAGDKVARAEHFKIALDLRVHPGAVNDRVSGAVGLHFIDRERVADDVGELLHVLLLRGGTRWLR